LSFLLGFLVYSVQHPKHLAQASVHQ
jgi:hypothetical protein